MKHSALLTDLYQLTMAAGYWQQGMAERQSVFHLFFRKLPFGSGYAIAAGLADAVEWLEQFHFDAEALAYLETLPGADGKPIFTPAFLDYLSKLRWTGDLDAIPEGTAVFPHQPLIRIKGPLVQAQLAETALLNVLNFQTLIATKAARICQAAAPHPVMEFGLRRAQGPDGALMACRAAFIGGCKATSNVLAGQQLGIPVRGTHAHSWVMSFPTESAAFSAYAEALPNNCIFLVDTYDTLDGVRHAIAVGQKLRQQGHEMVGIRLDSGDLASLSQEARKLLDAAGFPQAQIVASNDLDEELIESLKQQGAAITSYGVGTKLITGGTQAALGGVYKLGAIQNEQGQWEPKIKLSEQAVKVSNPGFLQVRRYTKGGKFAADALYDELHGCESSIIVDPDDHHHQTHLSSDATQEDLLQPIFRQGKRQLELPTLSQIQQRTLSQLDQLDPSIKQLKQPQRYPAGLELSLWQRKEQLIRKHHEDTTAH
jgi:nicotinate phosphoribosyltransferase